MPLSPSITTVFLDRDGVINRRIPGDYVKHPRDFEFLPGVIDALARLRAAGVVTVVVTNQRGVARGLFTLDDLAAVHEHMQSVLRGHAAQVDAIESCPDADGPRRKPAPGMFLDAMRSHPHIDPARALVVGDSASDIEAGHAAGVQGVLVVHGEDAAELDAIRARRVPLIGTAASLAEAVDRFVLGRAG